MKANGDPRPAPLARDRDRHPPSLVDVAKNAAEDLLDLMTAQIKLARLELSADLRVAVGRLVRLALFIPPLVVGYAFGMAALAAWLGDRWGRPTALAAVAALQIGVGAAGLVWSVAALKGARVLERTGADIADGVQRTIAAVSDPAPGATVVRSQGRGSAG